MSEAKPSEVRVYPHRSGQFVVAVDAPEACGEIRVATERDATPFARFLNQGLAAVRGGGGVVLTRGEFAAVKKVHDVIQAAAVEQFGDVIRSATDDVMKASLMEVEAAIRAGLDAGTPGAPAAVVPASPEARLRGELEAAWPGASERQVVLAELAAQEFAAAMIDLHARRPGRSQG